MIKDLQKKIGYEFKDESLLTLALTHKSYKKGSNNERLEFLGDAVVDLVVGEYLFLRFPTHQEGKLSKIRASIVNEEGLAKFALFLDMPQSLLLSNAEESNNGRYKHSILADAFEALIGAIYLESGLQKAKEVILSLVEKFYSHIDFEGVVLDYKTALQELTQAKFSQIPEYILISEIGPDHQKSFEMAVRIEGREYARAVGGSKKSAQQECAKIAYEVLKN